MGKLISVIIPVYMVEDYLDRCVESIVNQTYKNLEIILVDDGSPDKCPTMCDKWAKEDRRIRVIHKQNGGLSSARNAGLDVCTGDYIMFVDSDDYCALNICEVLLDLLEKNKADVTVCKTQCFDEKHPVKSAEIYSEVLVYSARDVIEQIYGTDVQYLMTAWGKLYKKELFENIRYPIGKLHEDEFIIAELLHKTSRFVYVKAKLYYYFQRSSSITGNISEKNIQDLCEAYINRHKFLNEKYPQNIKKNNQLLLTNLRSLYCLISNNKELKNEIFKTYKGYYKVVKKHDKKNWLFYNFNWLYMFLLKIKKLKGRTK